MKKYPLIEHYDFETLIQIKEIETQTRQVKKPLLIKLYFALATAIILISTVFFMLVFIGISYKHNEGAVWMYVVLIVPPVFGILLIKYYDTTHKKMVSIVNDLPVFKELAALDSAFYYNHILKQIPDLKGVVVTFATNEFKKIMNDDFRTNIKTFSLDASQALGGQICFTYKNHNFIYTNECVGIAEIDSLNRRWKKMVANDVSYYITALLSADLSATDQTIFYINQNKLLTTPAGFKLFQSESVEFNNRLSVYYNCDELTAFQKFNPLVVDNFNKADLTHFKKIYATMNGIVVYDNDKTLSNYKININSIYNLDFSGISFVPDLEKSVKRFEKNLIKLSHWLNLIKPFYD